MGTQVSDLKPCPFCGLPDWNRRAHLTTETAALRKVRDEMAEWRELVSHNPAHVTESPIYHERVDRWLAALDAILRSRE